MAYRRVAGRSDVPPGTTKTVVTGGLEIMLCNVDGEFAAVEDVCTHDGGPLDQGELEGRCVVCPRHGATFDVFTGAPTMPAVMPIATYPVRLEGEDILVDA